MSEDLERLFASLAEMNIEELLKKCSEPNTSELLERCNHRDAPLKTPKTRKVRRQ